MARTHFQKGKLSSFVVIYLFYTFFTFFSFLECLEKRPFPLIMKTSIIVPCHYKHFYLIPELLIYYLNQTKLPDEIVISVSECERIPEKDFLEIENKNWPFGLKILKSKEIVYSGGNRNKACDNSIGDLLIFQDADDIPHPQRVEIIKYLFENYQIDHLFHFLTRPNFPSFKKLDFNEVINLSFYYKNYPEEFNSINAGEITNGEPAIMRYVFEQIKWPNYFSIGEDVDFNNKVYSNFKYKVVLKAPLILYRQNLSIYSQPDRY